MAFVIADTDVLIDYLGGRTPATQWVAQGLKQGNLGTTVISYFELFSGAKTPRQETMFRDLVSALPILDLDPPAAYRASRIRRLLEDQGLSIGMGDSLIAGMVLHHQSLLLTRNRRHFQRVPDLQFAPVPNEA